MILFFASTENKAHADMVVKYGTGNALTTYYSLKNKPNHIKEFYHKYWFKSYFLDSGAFGAFTRNESLDVVVYGEFLKKNKKYLNIYANLDDKHNHDNTHKNLKYLKSIWLDPLPVWWMDTKDWWKLKELFDEYDYIAVWGLVGSDGSATSLTRDMNRVFKMALSYWKNPDGSIKKKIHGFWLTKLKPLLKYPFYSVDSTTRTNWARFWVMQVFNWKEIVNIQAKDHSKIVQHFKYIPVKLRSLDLLLDHNGKINYLNRQSVCADAFKQVETYCTKVWRNKWIFYK